MPSIGLGESIPPDTAHAVSVSLPTWRSNVGYEEGESWVMSRLTTGYPRFFIHNSIKAFAADIAERFGQPGQDAMLFPGRQAAARCQEFLQKYATPPSVLDGLNVVHLSLDLSNPKAAPFRSLAPTISAVIFHPDAFPFAKQYWQHSGDGISSRRAEYCHKLFAEGLLVRQAEDATSDAPISAATNGAAKADGAAAPPVPSPSPAVAGMKPFRGPKRYSRPMSPISPAAAPTTLLAANSHPASPGSGGNDEDEDETARYLEERFGRNLDLSFVRRATSAIRRRITGALTAFNDIDRECRSASRPSSSDKSGDDGDDANLRGGVTNVRVDDVYLVPCGMNAVFNAHQYLLEARPDFSGCKSIDFGFPYVDTLKILQKFGAGCLFYGHASEAELDDLETRLRGGERFLALFCEFPGNPLLTCPNLVRIRQLADAYDFAVVVDETIGTFANVNVLPYADIVVSSLTKIFSGDANVMGGSLVLNRRGRYYEALKAAAAQLYEPDAYWPEDVIFMERNSRDFAARVDRINANAEAICDILRASPLVRELHYPKYGPSRANYEVCRIGANNATNNTAGSAGAAGTAAASHAAGRVGGYGGLLSFTFHRKDQAIAFYDAVETAKGPSLGTNFTLTSPYVVLAHYMELDWCAGLGVDPDLLRVSVGLEDTAELRRTFETALAAAAAAASSQETGKEKEAV